MLADVPESGEGYVVRLRVTNEQSLQYTKRLVRDVVYAPSTSRCADLHQKPN
jgi:hypothetical protein